MWRLPRTSGYSYSRVAVIRIDVHPVGENPTNTIRALPTPAHICPAYASCGWFPYMAPFMSHRQSWAGPLLPRKRVPNTIHNALADQLMGPYLVSLPGQPLKQWGQSQASIGNQLLGLPGPYHQYAIGTFNTCSQGPTHRSLTNTGGGYNLGGAGFPHTTRWPSQQPVSPFHLRPHPVLGYQLTHYHLN
jgi:hypothetical protein